MVQKDVNSSLFTYLDDGSLGDLNMIWSASNKKQKNYVLIEEIFFEIRPKN